ncbi:uncharacterized protein LOC136719138 isoform X2 [Amia ocellicauda]|uniref:uncharacterized protein LOC136719138 isoform X2 n=1 Tax=Amia ocellicauda TaxID=2972642 RepID=UPI0034643ACA
MIGVYLGMDGVPPRVKHPTMTSHRIYRRGRWSVKTPTECRCYNKIELLRVKEPQLGFTGAVVKPKVKTVGEEEGLPPFSLTKKSFPTTEELKILTRKILREYATPSMKDSGGSPRIVQCCTFRACSWKSWGKDPFVNLPKNSAGAMEATVLKTVLNKQRKQSGDTVQLHQHSHGNSHGIQCSEHHRQSHDSHRILSIQNLQIHLEHKKLPQPAGFESSCWLTSANNQFLLPSVNASVVPAFLPRTAVSMERVRHAGRPWYSCFPGNRKPIAVSSVPASLVSRSLELKRRLTGHGSLPQVSEDCTATEHPHKSPGSARARSKDVIERKDALAVQEQHISLTDTAATGGSMDTIRNTQHEEKNNQPIDSCDPVNNARHFSQQVTSQTCAGDEATEPQQPAALNGETRHAKQIEVIINLKTKEESTQSDCSDEG